MCGHCLGADVCVFDSQTSAIDNTPRRGPADPTSGLGTAFAYHGTKPGDMFFQARRRTLTT